MRVMILDRYDGSTGFRQADVPIPVPNSGQVLVRVKASGVNPIDYKIRKGLAPYAMPDLPAILGTDLSGIVEQVGDAVVDFVPGDEVFGLTGGVRGLNGSLAEFVAVDARLLAKKPKNIDFREAAALPLVSLTAWEGLVDRANVCTGQKVLIQGGGGGVGHVAIQIARARGAQVFATARGSALDTIRTLGATPIDLAVSSVESYVDTHTDGRGFDIVYDTIGGAFLDASFEAVSYYGHVVSCAAFGNHALAPASLRCATISGVFVLLPMLQNMKREHHGAILKEIARLAEREAIAAIVDPQVYRLEEAMLAHDAVEQKRSNVKTVITVE